MVCCCCLLSATGVVSDRITQYNYKINIEVALPQDKKDGGSLKAAVQRYEGFTDMQLGCKMNDLCRSIGSAPVIPLLDVTTLEVRPQHAR